MKRILVLADTHRNIAQAEEIIQRSQPLDGMIHLGDFVQDAHELQQSSEVPLWAVAGNHDYHNKEPYQRIFTIDAVRIFACHGDRYDLTAYCPDQEWEDNIAKLLRHAKEAQCQCVLFGHSHIALCQKQEGMLIMNPGSMLLGETEASYGMLYIEEDKVKGDLSSVSNQVGMAGNKQTSP